MEEEGKLQEQEDKNQNEEEEEEEEARSKKQEARSKKQEARNKLRKQTKRHDKMFAVSETPKGPCWISFWRPRSCILKLVSCLAVRQAR